MSEPNAVEKEMKWNERWSETESQRAKTKNKSQIESQCQREKNNVERVETKKTKSNGNTLTMDEIKNASVSKEFMFQHKTKNKIELLPICSRFDRSMREREIQIHSKSFQMPFQLIHYVFFFSLSLCVFFFSLSYFFHSTRLLAFTPFLCAMFFFLFLSVP